MKILFRDCPVDDESLRRLRERFPQIRIASISGAAKVREEIRDADGVIGGAWDDALLAEARALRWVQSTFAGVDHLPVASFERRNIALTTFRGASAPNLAEHVVALILSFARGLHELARRQAARQWRSSAECPHLFELGGQRVGLLGIGALGTAIGEKCHALGMEVWAAVRRERPLPGFVSRSFPMAELERMLAEVDHLVLSLPSTRSTRGIMNARTLAALRKGAYVYNVGRGDSIDPPALIAALDSGHLGGAGLDVTVPEPLPADSPLWGMPNVIITGHTSGIAPKRWGRGMEIITQNIERFSRGEPLVNLVSPD